MNYQIVISSQGVIKTAIRKRKSGKRPNISSFTLAIFHQSRKLWNIASSHVSRNHKRVWKGTVYRRRQPWKIVLWNFNIFWCCDIQYFLKMFFPHIHNIIYPSYTTRLFFIFYRTAWLLRRYVIDLCCFLYFFGLVVDHFPFIWSSQYVHMLVLFDLLLSLEIINLVSLQLPSNIALHICKLIHSLSSCFVRTSDASVIIEYMNLQFVNPFSISSLATCSIHWNMFVRWRAFFVVAHHGMFMCRISYWYLFSTRVLIVLDFYVPLNVIRVRSVSNIKI